MTNRATTVGLKASSSTITQEESCTSYNNQSSVTTPTKPQRPPPPTATLSSSNRRSTWLEASVVRRSVAPVKQHVQEVLASSPFLQQHHNNDSFPVFARSEIRTGRMLGSGGFSQVHAIVGFDLDPTVSALCAPVQQQLRLDCANQVLDQDPAQPRFAIKHLKRRLVHSAKDFQRAAADLAVEALYMQALDHPNILRIRGLPQQGLDAYSGGTHDGYFIITDRLEGTLGDAIHIDWKQNVRNSPTVAKKAELSLELARALEYLHSKRIVFRDLKPQNIGVSSGTGAIQLFDFGLCRELPSSQDATRNGGTYFDNDEVYDMSGVGTRRYMAPDIVNGEPYNCKVDVYGWAVVTWELLTGLKPYATYGSDEHTRLVCKQGERPLVRFDWPEWLQDALERAWCASIQDRWPVARVVSQLDKALNLQLRQQLPLKHVPDSPVGVCDLVNDDTIEDALAMPNLLKLPFGARSLSLSPRMLSSSNHDRGDESEDESGRLLGLTLCVSNFVERCDNEDKTSHQAMFDVEIVPTVPARRKFHQPRHSL